MTKRKRSGKVIARLAGVNGVTLERAMEHMKPVEREKLQSRPGLVLQSDLIAAEDRIRVLEKALKFYRDKAFAPKTHARYGGLVWVPSVALLEDCGDTARLALEGGEQ